MFLLWLANATGLSSIVIKIIAIAAVISAIGAGIFAFAWHERNIGWNNAIAAIAAKDKEALDAVHAATAKVEACSSNYGVWDTVNGVCIK